MKKISKIHERVISRKKQKGFFILPFGSGGSSYQIANSLRLRASASAYLSRTFGTPTDNRKYTISGWVKRGKFGVSQAFFPSKYTDGSNYHLIYFNPSDQIVFSGAFAGSSFALTSYSVFRDPSAWYHIAVVFDSNNGTANLRALVYVNNVAQQLTGSNPGSGQQSQINTNATTSYIGADLTATDYLDGYLSDVYFIDGQALTPSSFGEQNSDGVWVPKRYSGTYGNNGFYLPFNDGTSATTLCYDRSGNGNHWTPSGISTASGVTYDWMTDTPTNNYATLNPLAIYTGISAVTYAEGNLKASSTSNAAGRGTSTIEIFEGKYYFEVSLSNAAGGTSNYIGVWTGVSGGGRYYMMDGTYWNGSGYSAYGSAYISGDLIGCAIDMTGQTIEFFKNGVSQGQKTSIGLTSPVRVQIDFYIAGEISHAYANFGQRPFAYTPPTGFKALCTANMPAVAIPNPSLHHYVTTLTKSGDTSFTLPWNATDYDTLFEIKRRDASGDWYQVDGLRGYDKILKSNYTAAETTDANVIGVSGKTITLKSTLTDGTYVVRAWKAGLASARQTNTSGSITSTVSANTTAGFSIVTYTGNGGASGVGHGLGAVPKFFVVKRRSDVATSWAIYHAAVGATKVLQFDTNAAITDATSWSNAEPTSSVFYVGTAGTVNTNTGTHVAYCWAEIPGYSKFGSHTGNASSDGVLDQLGFTPSTSRTKCSSTTGNWIDLDAARDTYNVASAQLYPNLTNAETSATTADLNAGSIKYRTTSDPNSAQTFIYAAWAKHPFSGSNVAPAPAR